MSHRIAAKITGVAGYVPPKVMTNADLEKIVETNENGSARAPASGNATSWRRAQPPRTWRQKRRGRCWRQTKTDPAEIDLIVLASVTFRTCFFLHACLVQERIGAKKRGALTFPQRVRLCLRADRRRAVRRRGHAQEALVIGSDTMTSVLDYKDRATCVLFGDGAGAVLLEGRAERRDPRFRARRGWLGGSVSLHARRRVAPSLQPGNRREAEHYVHQEGSQVFKYAVRRMTEMAAHLLEKMALQRKI